MKKEMKRSHIATKGGDVEWKIDAFIMTHQNDDMDEFTDVRLYTEGQYGYYEREHTICSDNYGTTFRFGKDKMSDVFRFLADNPLTDLEKYLTTIEGCEMVSQERYTS